ncbi:hypothetical protein V2W63_20865 [Acinetobacter baumannii]|uniref:hypothetical protein n=3 Tax=Gammaproteobacteria TaxID=1236 RepID=UPI00312CB6A1
MDKCREEFEKQKYWIGLFRDAVDFDEELGRYVLNGQRKLYAFHLDSFNEKWAIWQEAWQHQQAKVEELQTQLSLQRQRVKAFEEELTSSRNYGDELQKRVDELEFQLKDWKQKSMPAMLNGMCGRCGKEPLQGIGSDKEDYALLHCFGCGANKYEWIGEQALKGEKE